MNKAYHFLLSLLIAVSLAACTEDTTEPPFTICPGEETEDYFLLNPGRRTIIAYITGDNNLSGVLSKDITEMVGGSTGLQEDCRLIVFADINGQTPYIANIRDGKLTKVREYENEFYSTSPDSMRSVFQWIIDHYPSTEYAAIISGHGSGPIIKQDTVQSEFIKHFAYGYDGAGEVSATSTSKWMNIPSMAMALTSLHDSEGQGIAFSYIFFDCCCMQTAEVAYELRNSAKYIIAPLSETPGGGADYNQTMIAALCLGTDEVPQGVITNYANESDLCISAIRPDQMEALCAATRKALKTIQPNDGSPLILNRAHCVYYYKGSETGTTRTPVLHELKQLMKINLSEDDYAEWLPYLERTVVAKHLTTRWLTVMDINFYDFQDYLTDEYFGGLSMIAPTDVYDEHQSDINATMLQLQWCNAVGWRELGW